MIMVQLLIIYRTFHSLRTADNLLKFSVCDKSKEKGNEFCIKLMCSIYLFIYLFPEYLSLKVRNERLE